MATAQDAYLRPEVMESQLSTVELIRAMYPPPVEDDADSASTQQLITCVRDWCENPDTAAASCRLPSSLDFTVTIPIAGEDDSQPVPSLSIELNVVVPLTITSTTTTDDNHNMDPPPVHYSIRQPPWMSRAEVATLGASMPPDDIFAAFDYIQEHAPRPRPSLSPSEKAKDSLSSQQQQDQHPSTDTHSSRGSSGPDGPLLRVWFYFPSLSTREKRKDLVAYAPRYGLTGFVLAGKPGVLCLEGTARAVDGYMAAIKNESWGDIPSHQKKVSERFREEIGPGGTTGTTGMGEGTSGGTTGGDTGRKFADMTEITDALGERRGARRNRGDMAALEAFLKEKGVGDSFAKVIMGQ